MACEREGIRPAEVKPRVASSSSGGETVTLPPEGNIAAIDFGTTTEGTHFYLAVAYTTEADSQRPIATCFKLDGYNSRVPAAILLKKKGVAADSSASIPCEIIAFGSYANFQLRAKDADKHLYFEMGKMNLQYDPVRV